jgi:hypothetical protein
VVCALLIAACGASPVTAGARAETIVPGALSERTSALIDQTAVEWTAHESPDGQLLDPVLGAGAGSYGEGMTGGAMTAAGQGAATGERLTQDGLNAELYEIARPDGGGFELLSLAEDYVWNQAHLAGDPAWQAAQPQLAAFLSTHGALVSGAGVCYTTSNCYDNLKLVAAVAELALLRTGLASAAPGALLDAPHTLRLGALAKLAAAASNTGRDATHSGTVDFAGAGILSDPGQNPLAYHALSTLMLGHAVAALGVHTPPVVDAAFSRAARALVGLIAPDGDVAYIGRGQGQVWTVAATVDALSLAAANATEPVWRGRYLAGAQLALSRLETLYPRSGWGFPVVPRLADTRAPLNYLGIDGYANSVEYNGLALWALRDAAAVLAGLSPTPAQAVPSQSQGVFLDPSHTRFATVTAGRLWYAVHGTDSNFSDDRYGFGLVAAELYTGEHWSPVLPFRPLTYRAQVGGVAMRIGARAFYPIGQRISATRDGAIRIAGRWAPTARLAHPRALWVYRPSGRGDGVVLSFAARPRAAFQFQVWFQEGSLVLVQRDGLRVREPDGLVQVYSLNAPVTVRAAGIAHSAYTEDLASAIITLPAARHWRGITYTTTL